MGDISESFSSILDHDCVGFFFSSLPLLVLPLFSQCWGVCFSFHSTISLAVTVACTMEFMKAEKILGMIGCHIDASGRIKLTRWASIVTIGETGP